MKTKIIMLLIATLFLFTLCKKKDKDPSPPPQTNVVNPNVPDTTTKNYWSFRFHSNAQPADTTKYNQLHYSFYFYGLNDTLLASFDEHHRFFNSYNDFDTIVKVSKLIRKVTGGMCFFTNSSLMSGGSSWQAVIDTSKTQSTNELPLFQITHPVWLQSPCGGTTTIIKP